MWYSNPYQTSPFPTRLPAPEPNLAWLSTQKRPYYPRGEDEPVQCNPLSFFQPRQGNFTNDLVSSLLEASTATLDGLDSRSTTTNASLATKCQFSSRSHSLSVEDAERLRRHRRLRYRERRKQRKGMFPWQRRKTPRTLSVEKFVARGKLAWLVEEIARVEDEMGGDGRGWKLACWLASSGFQVDGLEGVGGTCEDGQLVAGFHGHGSQESEWEDEYVEEGGQDLKRQEVECMMTDV